MTDPDALQSFLDAAYVEPEVFALRRDYRALLVGAEGLDPGRSSSGAKGSSGGRASEALLCAAEASVRSTLADQPVEEVAEVAAWREAYRAFGAKPQRTRNSLEALLRRAGRDGLPRVNQLTDIYNAISVLHLLPLGGEDLNRYTGAPRLIRATGSETFDTVANGSEVLEHPDPGEIVWCDEVGVTCRRWNWRQASRTQLREDTTAALFILDALDPTTDDALDAAADDLADNLSRLGTNVRTLRRLLTASEVPERSEPRE